jgi:hypothetical protein
MKATMRRALIAAAVGLAVAAGGPGLGADEAHARVSKPGLSLHEGNDCTPRC